MADKAGPAVRQVVSPAPAPGAAVGAAGFTLVEMMVTIAVIAILALLAAPSFSTIIRNTQVRSAADAMQNGLRLAQTEAVRRSRVVVFSLTSDTPSATAKPAANAPNWLIQALPVVGLDGSAQEFIQGGAFGDATAGVTINGPASLCFNSEGRLVTGKSLATGITCAAPANGTTVEYDVSRATAQLRVGSDRPLRLQVSLGGQVRMCDPARRLSSDNPDGC